MNILIINILVILFFASCNQPLSDSVQKKEEINNSFGEKVTEMDTTIFIVLQDKKNNYWFGSGGKGIYYYDGKSIINYTTKDGLSDNSIRGIQEDHSGNILISTLGGIDKFDGEKITKIPIVENSEWKLDSNDLWFSILGKENEAGPYRYDGKVLYHLKFPKHPMEDDYYKTQKNKSWSPYEVYSIYKDKKGNIWLGTANFGLCRYDGKNISWLYENHLTYTPQGGMFGIRSIIEDKEGKFWFCNTNYQYEILEKDSIVNETHYLTYKKEKTNLGQSLPPEEDYFYFMSAVKDNENNLWMATYDQGIFKYDGKNLKRFSVMYEGKESTVFSIYKDHQGNIWLGTHQLGVFKFNGEEFEPYKY